MIDPKITLIVYCGYRNKTEYFTMKSRTLAKKYHFWFIQVDDVRTRFELYQDALAVWATTTKGQLRRGDGAVYDWKPFLPAAYTG